MVNKEKSETHRLRGLFPWFVNSFVRSCKDVKHS